MRVLAAGGGSGGHVTPVVAVLQELKSQDKNVELRFWCDRKFAPHAKQMVASFDDDIKVESIFAGKLRRYHDLSLFRQLTYPPIVLANLRDIFLVVAGFIQSMFKMVLWRPDVVFTKGGFVCLPIGLAAWLLRIPLVIHDSDAHPGLTNRILSRFATAIATGAPLKHYSYPKERSHYVGIPISSSFKPLSEAERQAAKLALGVESNRPLVVVTGGGLGAKRINDLTLANLERLSEVASVILISGTAQYDELKASWPVGRPNLQLYGFVSEDMASMLGAADLVVARAGATTILELAALKMPTILIPNRLLTGGHQLKNAAVYAEAGAVVVLDENQLNETPGLFGDRIIEVLNDEKSRKLMTEAFYSFSRPDAAASVADIIVTAAES